MTDPTNRLPTDPDWLRKVDTHAREAAKDLDSMVLMISIQENGKLCMSFGGVPDSGDLAELAKDVPNMLVTLASIVAMQNEHGKKETRQ